MNKLICDDEFEQFSRSECPCSFCKETHDIVDVKWGTYKPDTNLQRCMYDIIKSLEQRFNNLNRDACNEPCKSNDC